MFSFLCDRLLGHMVPCSRTFVTPKPCLGCVDALSRIVSEWSRMSSRGFRGTYTNLLVQPTPTVETVGCY